MAASFQLPNDARVSWNPISYRPRQMRSLPFNLPAASATQSDRWSWSAGASSDFEVKPRRDGSLSGMESGSEDEEPQLPSWHCDDWI